MTLYTDNTGEEFYKTMFFLDTVGLHFLENKTRV